MESKIKFDDYQEHKFYHLNIYDTFQGPITKSAVDKCFADIERDAGAVFAEVQKAGMKAEEPRAAVMKIAGRYIKVYSVLLIECEYDPANKEPFASPLNWDKVHKAVKAAGGKIK